MYVTNLVEWQGTFDLAIFLLAVIWFGLYYQKLTFFIWELHQPGLRYVLDAFSIHWMEHYGGS